VPGVPGLARRPTTRQRRRDELAMTLTLVVVGLALAPPLGWLLGAWLAGPSDIPADDPPAAPLPETPVLAFEPDESAPH